MSPDISFLEGKVRQAISLYHEDKSLQAFAMVAEVEAALEDDHHDEPLFKQLKDDPTLQQMKSEAEQVNRLREVMSCDDGWKVASVTDSGVRTLFRQNEEGRHFYRVEGFVDAPLLDLLAILSEIDLWPQWMIPQTWVCGMRDARILKQFSPTHILCYLSATMPWPVVNRDVCVDVKAVDCMDAHEKYKRQIAVLLHSCTSYPGLELPLNPSYVHADVTNSGILLTPEIPADGGPIRRTHVQLLICANPKLRYTPEWVLQLFMRNLVFLFLPAVRNQVKVVPLPDSVYRQRIANNPELYGFLEKRMKECFPENDVDLLSEDPST